MKKLNIRIIAVLIAAVMILASAMAVFAVDTDYSGDLDPETNEPIKGSSSSVNRIELNSSMYYDRSSHDFVYPVENSLVEVHASVADGMIISEPASVSPGGDVSVVVYRDGQEVTGDLTNLRQAGDYVVTVKNGGTSLRLFSFTIVGASTNSLTSFAAPDGHYIVYATRDGQDIYQDNYFVDMEEEGLYNIQYEGSETDIIYTFTTTVDRTPPVLNFKGRADRQNRIHSALTFTGLQVGDTVVLIRDGVEVEPQMKLDGSGVISDSGNYIMRVYDAAGNMQEYTFTIMVYFNTGTWIFFFLVVGAAAGVAIYIFIKKKHLKIG